MLRAARSLFATATLAASFGAVAGCGASGASDATDDSAASALSTRKTYGDYAARGGLDLATLGDRLVLLHANTYAFLIGNGASDWDDFQAFLPIAERRHLEVWAYLLPPTEAAKDATGAITSTSYKPCGTDYTCWGRVIGQLARAHPNTNLSTIVIDDFFYGDYADVPARKMTRPYIVAMQSAARAAAGRKIAFMPIAYYNEIVAGADVPYAGLFDGAIVPYRGSIAGYPSTYNPCTDHCIPEQTVDSLFDMPAQNELACAVFKRPLESLEVSVPPSTPSNVGDYAAFTKQATVTSATTTMTFRYFDDYYFSPAVAAGYHYLQLLVDGNVAWEHDVAAGPPGDDVWHQVSVDVSATTAGKSHVTIAFRLYDKRPVSNFGVSARVYDVKVSGLGLGATWTTSTSATAAAESWTPKVVARNNAGRCVPMVYASGTSWSPAVPSPDYVSLGLRHVHDAIAMGTADGVITYSLDKSAPSVAPSDFATTKALYTSWW